MKLHRILLCTLLGICAIGTRTSAQDGHQILDGIGETGLISRHVFDGDARDWSRNTLHARVYGTQEAFVEDQRFGKTLSLSAGDQAYAMLPGEAVEGEESLSITGWVYLRSDQPGQLFFDFGKDGRNHFFLAPFGTRELAGFHVGFIRDASLAYTIASPDYKLEMDQWVHLALVLDIPSKTISTYVNGERVGNTENFDLELDQFFTHENKLYIGRSLNHGSPFLDAKVGDFRIYRIPLEESQIARIRYNALRGGQGSGPRERPADNLPQFDLDTPQLYHEFLIAVSDVAVETPVGTLPRLPRYVKGTYSNGKEGPPVRVIWPAPTDNSSVLRSGSHTITGRVSGTDFAPKAVVTVKAGLGENAPDRTLEAFALDQVALNADLQGNKTKFIENRDKFINTLAGTNTDSFLYMFRNAFGQQQPEGAKPLGVWDSQETKLRGHATGHYLTALAQAYAGTGYDKALQANFAQKMEYMVEVLYALSQMSGNPQKPGGEFISDPTKVPPVAGKAQYDSDLSETGIRTDYWNWGKGFISAYPPDQFIMLEQGATYGTQTTQIWAPYYTLHKIMAGLLDIYEVSGNEKALEIAKGMGDWVHARLSQLSTQTLISMWDMYIAGEFGGMNEAMARLERISGEARYLETARLFDNIRMFFGDAEHSHGLAKNVDSFRGLHANQHIPQIVGALEIYRDSELSEYFQVADNFWYRAKNDYMYSIGGVAGARNPTNAECFIAQPASLYENGFASGGQNETCATYNMLKLTRNLFLFEQRPELMDYYERGLYNHILASVAEDSPANTYHVPLRPGSIKQFGNPDMTGFTCCNGTAIESSTKLQNSIYFRSRDNEALYVNLFVPSTLDWTQKGITVEQRTSYPREDRTQLLIRGKGRFDLNLRVPQWATNGFELSINGKVQKVDAKPGSYLKIGRKWKDGDTVEVIMPFGFYLDPVMDQQNIASIFYGPILLVAQEGEARNQWRKVSLDGWDIEKSIQGDPKKLEFMIDGVEYRPFYETYGRHSVYLDVELE